jgi:hypothetical protein
MRLQVGTVFGPKGLPRTSPRWNEVNRILQLPDVKERMTGLASTLLAARRNACAT